MRENRTYGSERAPGNRGLLPLSLLMASAGGTSFLFLPSI